MKRLSSGLRIVLKASCTFFLLLLILVVSVSLTNNKMLVDVWQQLGIKEDEGNTDIIVSVMSDHFQYPGGKAKNISQQFRVAIVNQLVAYAKKYTSSAEFKKDYDYRRSVSMPKKPNISRVNVDSIKAAEKKNIELQIKQTEANANNPNPKIKNAVPYRLEALKKDLKSVDDGTNRMVQTRIKEMQQMSDAQSQAYQKDMEKLNQKLPANPQDLIKRRLQDLLDITGDVDFSAETKENPATKFKVFVNPDYEKKSKDWKLAFRAGKELTDITRAAAQKWLAEIK